MILKSLKVVGSLLVLSLALSAQSATGVLQGRVTDSSGAAVPQAKVTVQNEATGVALNVPSNAEGNFLQSYLLPANYLVTVEKAGFSKYATSHIRVDVDQTVSLNVELKIGDVATTVEVTATGTLLTTTNGTVSTVIEGKQIMDLPLNGRGSLSLITLTPGVVPGGGSTPWISGGRNATSEITVDGTSIILPENNVSINTTGYTPIIDSIEEFAVITNSLSAEYGRTGGGTVNFATKSGTNTIHGSVYDYFQNSALNANSWTSNKNGVRKNPYQNNWFGGTIGGPIWIPHVYNGKNRTFFFFSEQSNRSRNTSTFTGQMPTQDWLNGDFSQLKNGSGQAITIYDPQTAVDNGQNTGTATRSPFPNNIVPQNRWDPVAVNLKKYWVAPNNLANITNQFTFANDYILVGKAPSNDDKFDSRVDHNFSQKFRVFARGSYELLNQGVFNGFGAGNAGSSNVTNGGPNQQSSYNIVATGIYTISPTTVMNMSVGWGHFNEYRVPSSEGTCPASLGFPAAYDAVAKISNCEFPNISVSGVTGLGQATFTTLFFKPASWPVKVDLVKIHGNHTFKAGLEYRKMFMNFTQLGQPDGQFSFNGTFTQQVTTAGTSTTQGFGMASFLLGAAGSGSISHTIDIAEASTYWGAYLQDDWKVNSKLSLSLGLRWEADVPRTERYNRLSYFDINAPSPLGSLAASTITQCPGCANLRGAMKFVSSSNRHQVPTDTNNFGPRVSLAYRVDNKMVFRAAYAIMYAGSVLQAAGTSGSSGTEGFTSTTNMITTFDSGETIAAFLRNPFPNGFNLPLGATNGPFSGNLTNIGGGISESFFSDNANPMIQQWNGTLQREMKGGILLEAGYIGGTQHHLIDGENELYNQIPDQYIGLGTGLNAQVTNPFNGVILAPTSSLYNQKTVALSNLLRPYPQYTGINAFRKPGGNANYNSFLAKAQKRFSHGLSFLVSYTGGKLIDDVSSTVNFLGATGSKQDAYNRKGEKSISAQDVSRDLVGSFNYELPAGRGKAFMGSAPKLVDAILGGWQVNGIYTYRTGLPLQIGNGGNSSGLGSGGLRPNNNGQDPKLSGAVGDRINMYFNTADFSQTPNFQFGNTSRTSPDLRGPSFHGFDASLFKRFTIHESGKVEVRAESFNFFNHPVWGGPNTTVNSVGPTGFGTITSKSGNRTLQLVLRLSF